MRVLPETIFRYRPEINRKEFIVIKEYYDKIWEKLSEEEPDGWDENIPQTHLEEDFKKQFPVYLRNGIKVVKYDEGVQVLLTNTEPYEPVYHKWILELILENI